MNVAALLKAKGRRVVTARQEVSIHSLMRRMAQEQIGAVVVTGRADDRIEGLIGERDIVRGLAEHGAALLTMRVGDLMTHRIRTCTPEDSIDRVMAIMTNSRVRHLPVIAGNRLCGIVSIGDVVKFRLEEMQLEVDVLRDMFIAGRRIA